VLNTLLPAEDYSNILFPHPHNDFKGMIKAP
jgi:hypothetical protein